MKATASFAERLLAWFDEHGRRDLPWQQSPTPYRVWVSEIMLQQTQVRTAIPFYERFIERFPSIPALAAADSDAVLHRWAGLGYYARARNLHKAAQVLCREHGGELPRSIEALQSLPGIGRSTAGAIGALAMNLRAPILDGNAKRLLTRHRAIAGWPEQSRTRRRLWRLADRLTPAQRTADYTQAIMDLGATVCTKSRPLCGVCPLSADCKARRLAQVADFPGRKPRKSLPVRSVAMFILLNEANEVLLEKRPPSGVWGSLYSLPESRSAADLPIIGQALPLGERIKLEPLRHSFSHYHLDITPVRIDTGRKTPGVAENDRWLWYPLDHSVEVGLAAPVKKLLANLTRNDAREEMP